MGLRKNVTALTDAEKQAYVAAVKAIKASGAYDRYVTMHNDAMMRPTLLPGETGGENKRNVAHRGPAFGPWHREMLRRFELDLQAVDPSVTVPYWDWAADQDDAANVDPKNAAVWDVNFMGGDGNGAGVVTTGPFAYKAGVVGTWAITADPSGPELRRQMGRDPSATSLPTSAEVDAVVNAGDPYDVAPFDRTVTSFRNKLEGFIAPDLHNRVHRWMGGSMGPGTSPNDPIFFLHHCNVDRIWARWQRDDPANIFRPDTGCAAGHNLKDPMWPWLGSTTNESTLDIHALGYWYDDEPPTCTFVNPDQGDELGGDVVVLTGMVFTDVSDITFGGMPVDTFFVDSDTQITLVTPMGMGMGSVDIELTNPNGTATAPVPFTYKSAALAPAVTAVTPSSGSPAGGETVVVAGTALTGATDVSFGPTSVANLSVDSDTQITVVTPPGSGTVDVVVTAPAGQSSVSPSDQFTYTAPGGGGGGGGAGGGAPTVTGLVPATGAPGDIVWVLGTGFTGATDVAFGVTSVANLFVDDDTQLTVVVPDASGAVDVTVVTAAGTSAVVAEDVFTYDGTPVPPGGGGPGTVLPVVTAVDPTSGDEAGGDTVVITGTSLGTVTDVAFGATSVADLVVDSDTQLTVTSPAGTGAVDVTVTSPDGTSVAVAQDVFTYTSGGAGGGGGGGALPVVTGVSPVTGDMNGGDTVVIQGTDLGQATDVAFGGTSVADLSVDSDTQLTVVTPMGMGTVDVIVSTPAGDSAPGPDATFTFQ